MLWVEDANGRKFPTSNIDYARGLGFTRCSPPPGHVDVEDSDNSGAIIGEEPVGILPGYAEKQPTHAHGVFGFAREGVSRRRRR